MGSARLDFLFAIGCRTGSHVFLPDGFFVLVEAAAQAQVRPQELFWCQSAASRAGLFVCNGLVVSSRRDPD
jgi:hypothetical protein